MESHEKLPLLAASHVSNGPDKPRSLRHEELLMVVRVVVGGEHEENRAGESPVDVGGDDALKHAALEDPVKLTLVLIEVVVRHRVCLAAWFAGLLGCCVFKVRLRVPASA